ncbi:hypothetical protein EUA70_02780 [TM7 phylum sp. oral taxon 352]|nr:hypothetical protein EUA70_02780 [TM7 phylum sp. oral taxon 352]
MRSHFTLVVDKRSVIIWISPFFVSPLTDFGYDIANYRAIDPTFGKMHNFQALLKKAQQNSYKLAQIVARQITC